MPVTGSFALNLSSRKYPDKVPPGVLVPDLVIAFTWMPLERPCEASKRLETNSNSPIASRLYRGWPKLSATWLVTCWPSRFNWNVMFELVEPIGVSATALARLPGASSVRSIQLRPLTGSSCICRGSTLAARLEFVVSTSGASPVTVTDSCTVDGAICRFSTAVWPISSSICRVTAPNPGSSASTLKTPTRTGMR